MKAQNLKENLEQTIKYNQIQIDKAKANLAENFVYHFPWVGEELYKLEYMQDHYKAMLHDIIEGVEINKVVEHWDKQFKNYTSRAYNVRENSTGSLFREASSWKFQIQLELSEWLNSYK